MTTFEITVIALLAVIMLMVIILVKTAIGGFHDVWQQLNANWEQLRKIETHTNFLADISMQLDNIEDNILDESVELPAIRKKLDDLRIVTPELQGALSDLAINSKGHYNELQQLREEIYSKRYLLGLDAKSFPPCYAPNGICTNPQMDCINCPKRGTGGTWSTSTNLNKED